MEREDSIGSIEVGRQADMIVLDRDLFEVPPEDLDQTLVMRTVFGGDTDYTRQ